jgi:4-carboxymuconolactone decarboxylase
MSFPPQVSPDLQRQAPKLAQITEEVLFGEIWQRPQLAPRERSLATVAALVAMGDWSNCPSISNWPATTA